MKITTSCLKKLLTKPLSNTEINPQVHPALNTLIKHNYFTVWINEVNTLNADCETAAEHLAAELFGGLTLRHTVSRYISVNLMSL